MSPDRTPGLPFEDGLPFDRGLPARERPPYLRSRAERGETRETAEPAESRTDSRPDSRTGGQPWSVTVLTQRIQGLVAGLGRVAVEGEVSRVTRPASGHVYFDLKDAGAKIACVVWRSQVPRALHFDLREGQQVVAHGALDVYAPRGGYTLVIERLEPTGVGALLARLEELKRELAARGWFERKRPLPALPRVIGVVTSRDGAAFRDFLRTRSLRWAGYPVRLAHAPVQGPGAARELAAALAALDRSGVDVIVLCRGGGSLEDLWCFNELEVAEAIRACSVPVVSGVGHETDVTIADFVADFRAHTPTDAAQTVIPERRELRARLDRARNYLFAALDDQLAARVDRLERLSAARVLRDPQSLWTQRLRELELFDRRLVGAARTQGDRAGARLAVLASRLEGQNPRAQLAERGSRLAQLAGSLARAGENLLGLRAERVRLAAARLDSISPLKVLGRGYSVTTRAGSTELLRSASDVHVGDVLVTRLGSGSVTSRVEETHPR